MRAHIQLLCRQADHIHSTRITTATKTGANLLLLAKLQTGRLVIMERTKGFAVPIHPYSQMFGQFWMMSMRDFSSWMLMGKRIIIGNIIGYKAKIYLQLLKTFETFYQIQIIFA